MPVNTQPTRVFDLMDVFSSRKPEHVMFTSLNNGQWHDYSVADYRQYADFTSYALINLGIKKGEAILSLTQNRAEFNFLDMGILQIGAVHVPLSPAIEAKKLLQIVSETNARIAFVSNRSMFRKLSQFPATTLEWIVSFDPLEGITHYEDFLKTGTENPTLLQKLKSEVNPEDTASVIYLSGSNTPVRGVELSHAGHIFNTLGYSDYGLFTRFSNTISFLPLAHSFERTMNYAFQFLGIRVYYTESMNALMGLLKSENPEVIVVVPLVLEKLFEKARNEIYRLRGIKGIYLRWILKLTLKQPPTLSGSSFSLKSFVFRSSLVRLSSLLGTNLKMIICGGAALNPELLNVFWAAGIRLFEGYGLTEAGPVVTCNNQSYFRAYSAGKPMLGVTIKTAPDGEILVRSNGNMKGYFNQTSSSIDEKGWLHTGDLGTIDEKGFLTLTGTKKDIFKLSSGLYTDPRPIEKQLSLSSLIKQIWVYGHNRNFLSAIVVAQMEHNNAKINPKLDVEANTTLQNDYAGIKLQIEKEILFYNSSCQKYDQIVKFEIVNDEWTVENGVLNDNGTLNRLTLYSKYKIRIDSFYM